MISIDREYNLDQAATTRVLPEAVSEAVNYMYTDYYNPSSSYTGGCKVHDAVTRARNEFAEMLGVRPDEIIFTSGGSESNSLAIDGTLGRTVITTNVEHKSIKAVNKDITQVWVGENGIVTDYALLYGIDYCKEFHPGEDHTFSFQYVNNETGVIQPIQDIVDKVKSNLPTTQNVIHSDGVQAIGHVPIDKIKKVINAVDMFSISGHKFGSPKGVGILVVKHGTPLMSIVHGTQNSGLRGGTENVPGIMAMLVAMKHAVKNCTDTSVEKNFEVREKLFKGINRITPIMKTIDDSKVDVVPNILNIRFLNKKLSGEALMGFLSAIGVYVSLGSACNAHEEGTSHVLKALKVSEEDALRTIRISFPDGLTDNDIEEILRRFDKVLQVLLRQ